MHYSLITTRGRFADFSKLYEEIEQFGSHLGSRTSWILGPGRKAFGLPRSTGHAIFKKPVGTFEQFPRFAANEALTDSAYPSAAELVIPAFAISSS